MAFNYQMAAETEEHISIGYCFEDNFHIINLLQTCTNSSGPTDLEVLPRRRITCLLLLASQNGSVP
jgi:hypothetical protein